MTDPFGGGDKGVDGGIFDETPIVMNDYAQSSGLKMQVNPEIDRLRIKTVQAVYAEIMSADLQQKGPFNDFIKSNFSDKLLQAS